MDEMDKMGLSDLFQIRDVDKVFLLCLVFWWIVFALLDKVKSAYEWAKKRFEGLMMWLGGMGLNQS